MMDLKRAGNLSHQDSGATRLLQFSRAWIVSSDGHFQSWHLQAAKTSPPTTETSVVEMLELGNLAEVSVLEIERNMATYGWHLRLKGRIWTGRGFHLKDLEGTYLLNMESCLQHPSRPKGMWNSRIELKTLWVPLLHLLTQRSSVWARGAMMVFKSCNFERKPNNIPVVPHKAAAEVSE